ncbi:Peptidoglycan/xylan/chitin deacetylase, PgdA/CDA1 family [Methylobacterium sp. 190mf]|nr:Peptidoglycan/xylan/chitin deacetylase, PgdA/CDA1 family [Methylobacterium sp. 190mf]
MRRLCSVALVGLASVMAARADAAGCSEDALGTSRILTVPVSYGPVGATNYRRTLPLERGEVVLTFDDGPMPRRTSAVLDALRAECVKATFFVVGSMVAEFPDLLRRTAAEGHTIATHTWSHRYLNRVRDASAQHDQINAGLIAARAVLGDADPALSPFFRFPGLGTSRALDRYAADQNLIPFSNDVEGNDWRRVTPSQVMERVLAQLDQRGKGIILLHDIQPRTVAMLPELLRQLKARGYRVVHVVPEQADTRQALAALDGPTDRRMQAALARLERAQATLVAATDRTIDGATALRPPAEPGKPARERVSVASADEGMPLLRPSYADRDERSPILPSTVNAPFGLNVTVRMAALTADPFAGAKPAQAWADPPAHAKPVAAAAASQAVSPIRVNDGSSGQAPTPSSAAPPAEGAFLASTAANTAEPREIPNRVAAATPPSPVPVRVAVVQPRAGERSDEPAPEFVQASAAAAQPASRATSTEAMPSVGLRAPVRSVLGAVAGRLEAQRLTLAQSAGVASGQAERAGATAPASAKRTGFVELTPVANAGVGFVEISH